MRIDLDQLGIKLSYCGGPFWMESTIVFKSALNILCGGSLADKVLSTAKLR